jgi:molybdate transport system substrate-binding protein
LTEAFTQIGADFEATHPDTQVSFNFAGSQQLAQQIAEGAPADVFASANQKQMEVAVGSGRVAASGEAVFVRNRLVVIVPAEGTQSPSSLEDLARPGIRLVIAAKEVPVGQYALDFLDKASQDPAFGPSYKEAVMRNVVSYEENVRAVLTKVVLGEADAGIVYTTDVTSDSASKVREIPIPDRLNTVAEYVLAPLSDSPHLDLARQFAAWVLSADGQRVLSRYGFLTVGP